MPFLLTLLQVPIDFTNQTDPNAQRNLKQIQGSFTSPNQALNTILAAIMAIAALLVLYSFISAALDWISASGDKGKLESARNKIVQGVIGLIILSAAAALFNLLQAFIGFDVRLGS